MEKEKFGEYVDQYRGDLYIVALSILHNQADAGDAISNAILRGYENIDQLKEPKKFKAWMITITKNEALKIKKKQLNLPGNETVEAMLEPVLDKHDELWDIIQTIRDEYRQVLILFYYEDLSLKDIAERLDIPLGTVKSRLNRGRDLLKESLEEWEEASERESEKPEKKPINKTFLGIIIVGLLAGTCVLAHASTANANIFSSFTKSIMDFFTGGDRQAKEAGVTSDTEKIQSKPDLMVNLQERIVDSENIYLLIGITAPTNLKFDEKMSFSHIGFYQGENYNESQLIGGAVGCNLLETMPGQENKAIFVVNISADSDIIEDSNVTLFMKDLIRDSKADSVEVLVEGMWSITFPAEYTAKENVVIQGKEDMQFSFLDTKALVEKIKITSLGMSIVADVSGVPADILNVSDTNIAVRLKMLDGSEILIMSHNFEDEWAVTSSGISYTEKEGKTYQKSKYEFADTLDTSKVMGVYIEDLYVTAKELETE